MGEKPRTAQRIGYIDMTKGIACLFMVMGHQMSFSFADMTVVEWLMLAIPGGFAATSFFFSSGSNVINFNDRYGNHPNFRAFRFYLLSMAALFLMSYTYQINRMAFGMWTLFHAIAASTAITFLFIRKRIPTWALMAIAFGFYTVYLVFWTKQLPEMERVRQIEDAMTAYAESYKYALSFRPFVRWLFFHFSFLPWFCYVLAGAATFRSIRLRPHLRPWWLAFYSGMLVLGVTSPLYFNQWWLHDTPLDLFLRHPPIWFGSWIGLAGLFIVGCDYLYKNADDMTGLSRRIWRYVEFLGRESFVFLIWHWIWLTGVNLSWKAIFNGRPLGQYPYNLHGCWIFATIGILLTMPLAIKLGEKWRSLPGFGWQAGAMMVGGSLLALGAMATGNIIAGQIISFGPCLAFCFSYPRVRGWLRKRYTVKSKPSPAST